MLNHVVMLTLDEAATAEARDAIVGGLRGLPEEVPGLETIDVRTDNGLADGNAGVFFHMRFVDEESWRAYTPHPAHQVLARDHILPVLRLKTALQFHD